MNPNYGKATITYTYRFNGWRRFFTWTYWRIQIAMLLSGQPPLNIVETFEGEISEGGEG